MPMDRGRKENISSNAEGRVSHRGSDDSLNVKEADVEKALLRLQAMVEGEETPSFWTDSAPGDATLGDFAFVDAALGDAALGDESHRSIGEGADDFGTEEANPSLPNRPSAQPVAERQYGSKAISPKVEQSDGLQGGSDEASGSAKPARGRTKKSRTSTTALARRRRNRIIWSTAAAVVVVGTLLSPLGGKAMAAAMQTLYFHNVVGVGQDDLSQIQQALQGAAQGNTAGVQSIDLKQYGSVDVSGDPHGYQSNLTIDTAQNMLGYPIRTLPGFDKTADKLSYQPGSEVTFRLNVPAINNLIGRLGGKTLLPSAVNGEPITVNIPAQVFEHVTGKNPQDNMSLTEMKMPTVQVPGNVDMNQVKQALLGLPFLPDDIRRSLATSANWQDTLYMPVGGNVTNMTVNGYSAVLQSWPNGQERSILWLQNGILYQLNGSPSVFPTDASIVAQAKEISQ